MEIKFKNLDGLEIEEYVIRDMVDTYTHKLDPASYNKSPEKYTVFQALVSGENIPKHIIIHFLAKYYDKDRKFLGLDEEDIWIQSNRKPISINANVTIPENIEIVEIELESRTDYSLYLSWLSSFFMVSLIIYGLNAVFHFW